MVKLNRIHLKNYKGFTDIKFEFNNQLTCIAGINGSGKSSILSAISKNLSLFANKGSFTSKEEYRLKKSDIHLYNNRIEFNEETCIRLVFDVDKTEIDSQNCITAKGDKFSTSVFTDKIELLEKQEFPLFCNYGATRTSKDIEKALNKETPVSDPFYLYRNLTDFENDYEEFFSWFRKREDIENERLIASQKNGIRDYQYDEQIQAVRNAIASFFGKNYELRVSRVENTLLVKNDKNEIPFTSLSDGEKSLLLLFGDIARKLAITSSFEFKDLPQNSKEILNRNGIILIDEIDLHLHPSWQRKVCKALKETFPNCQFVITTHSPQVLGELQPEEIRLLDNFQISIPSQSFGLDSNTILDSLQTIENQILSKNNLVDSEVRKINELIETKNLKEAREQLNLLEKTLHGSTSDTVTLGMQLRIMGA